jgi:hypothetical protein
VLSLFSTSISTVSAAYTVIRAYYYDHGYCNTAVTAASSYYISQHKYD